MAIGNIRPKTFTGIKRLASELRKKEKLEHHLALNVASRAAGYENFQDAQRKLANPSSERSAYHVLLTMYWRDNEESAGAGRETLRISISRPISDICSKIHLKNARGLSRFKMVADDHLISELRAPSQMSAREVICAAARSLYFMDHTGLRPLPSRQCCYPKKTVKNRIPNCDHASCWYDPLKKQYFFIDEPYKGVPDLAKRQAWAEQHNWLLSKTSWPGIYNPYKCEMYITTDGSKGYPLNELVEAINAIPAPHVAETWSGTSVPSPDAFLSPMELLSKKTSSTRKQSGENIGSRNSTIPYIGFMGRTERRPNGALTASGHADVGSMIKAILASRAKPTSVNSRMELLRSELEDWMVREPRSASQPQSQPDQFCPYYGPLIGWEDLSQKGATREGVIKMLGSIRGKLGTAYPDCAPLRRLSKLLATSEKLTRNMVAVGK